MSAPCSCPNCSSATITSACSTYYESALPRDHANLESIRADIRDPDVLGRVVPGSDAAIHLTGVPNTCSALAHIVRDVVRQELPRIGHIELEIVDAERSISYDLSAERLQRTLDWRPTRSVENAVVDLCRAFRDGKLPDPLTDPRYYNVKMIQSVGLV